jgi:molecular chaperone DnaJ
MAVVKRDYYEVLGVAREADEAAIKRAFHRLARDWHPDVADAPEAEARFRELAEAYSVLSKREARLLYDRYGYRGRGNLGFDEVLWEARTRVSRGEDVRLVLELRRFEGDQGTRRLVSYDALVRCNDCMGRGSTSLPDPECEYCGGSGRKRTISDLDAAQTIGFELCPACLAPCAMCGGGGTTLVERKLRLRVPPGLEDGTQLRVSGEGNESRAGSIPGDLLVRVSVLPPPRDPRLVRYIAFALLLIAIATLVLYVVH